MPTGETPDLASVIQLIGDQLMTGIASASAVAAHCLVANDRLYVGSARCLVEHSGSAESDADRRDL